MPSPPWSSPFSLRSKRTGWVGSLSRNWRLRNASSGLSPRASPRPKLGKLAALKRRFLSASSRLSTWRKRGNRLVMACCSLVLSELISWRPDQLRSRSRPITPGMAVAWRRSLTLIANERALSAGRDDRSSGRTSAPVSRRRSTGVSVRRSEGLLSSWRRSNRLSQLGSCRELSLPSLPRRNASTV